MYHLRFNDPVLGSHCADLLHQFYADEDLTAMRAKFGAIVRVGFDWISGNASGFTTKWFAARYANGIFIAIKGVDRLQHALGYIDGLAQLWDPGVPDRFPDYAVNQSNTMFARIDSEWGYNGYRVQVCGHSLGGVVATILGESIRRQNSFSVSCITLGAPKIGSSVGAEHVRRLELVRWMNDGDPVPRIPPNMEDSQPIHSMMTGALVRSWDRCVQPHGGTVLFANGPPQALHVPAASEPVNRLNIAQWLATLDGQLETPHHVSVYKARLDAVNAPRPVQIHAIPRMHGPQEVPRQDGFAAVERAVAVAQRVLRDIPLGQPARGQTKKVRPFTIKREGEGWLVLWSGNRFAFCKGKTAARNLARRGNSFLAHYSHAARGDDAQFVASVTSYLSALS